MKIKNIESYLDGGTIEIRTDKGNYFIDKRLNSITENKLYFGYPEQDNSNIIVKHLDKVEKELFEALEEYNPEQNFYFLINESSEYKKQIKEILLKNN